MKKLWYFLSMFFLWSAPSLAQPQNLQTTTLINIGYSNVSIMSFGLHQNISITTASNPSVVDGAGFNSALIGTSTMQYLKFTIFGSGYSTKSIAVSLSAPLSSDYYNLVLATQTMSLLPYGSIPVDHGPVQLSATSKVWLSDIEYGATGSGPIDGIPFQYELQKNPNGSYATLSGAQEHVVIIFTIIE